MDYNKLTKFQLREKLDESDITTTTRMTKAELIYMLKSYDELRDGLGTLAWDCINSMAKLPEDKPVEDNILKFRGTMNRTKWWIYAILLSIFGEIMIAVGTLPSASLGTTLTAFLFTLITIHVHIAINKARLNEAGWSGWWMLCPVLNLVVMGFFRPVGK